MLLLYDTIGLPYMFVNKSPFWNVNIVVCWLVFTALTAADVYYMPDIVFVENTADVLAFFSATCGNPDN